MTSITRNDVTEQTASVSSSTKYNIAGAVVAQISPAPNSTTRKIRFIYLITLIISFLSIFAEASIVDESFRSFTTKTNLTFVNAFLRQPDGKYLVGGTFSSVNGFVSNGLARLNADGTFDPSFRPKLNGSVDSLFLQNDGQILVGGSSLRAFIDGLEYQGVFRLNQDGSFDSSFLNGRGVSGVKSVWAQADGKVLITGFFSTVSGVSRWAAARLNYDGTLDPTFNANLANDWGRRIAALPDGKILIAGDFTSAGTVPVRNIIRVNLDGSLDTTFNLSFNGRVQVIKVLPDQKILIGGSFNMINGIPRKGIVRLNADGTLDESFNFDSSFPYNGVNDLDIQPDGKIIIGGVFFQDLSTLRYHLYRLESNGAIDHFFTSITGAEVSAVIVQPNGQIIAGGFRPGENLNSRNLFYRINPNDEIDPTFPGSVGDPAAVGSLAVLPNGKIYIVGDFTEVNGQERKRIARLNANGTLDTTFNATGANDRVFDIALQPDGKIIICGRFGLVNGLSSQRLARLNYDGSLDTTFNVGAGPDNAVSEVGLQPDGKILIGGVFQLYDNVTRPFFARLNADGSLDTTFDTGSPGLGNSVNEIVVQPDGKILIGGWFPNLNGVTVGQITRLNPDGSRDTNFNAGGLGTTGSPTVQRMVNSIALQPDGKILIGGVFQNYNNIPRTNLARLNADGSLDQSYVANTPDVIAGIRRHPRDGKYLIGGIVTSFNGIPVKNHFRLNADGSLDTGFDIGTGADDSVIESAFQPNGDIISVGIFKKVDGHDRLGIVRLKNSTAPLTTSKPFDFDGDGKSDISVYRPSNGQWWLNQSTAGVTAHTFGNMADKLVPADFTGDGKTDVAIFRPSSGEWFILRSDDFSFYSFPFGSAGDIPVVGDFDSDGKADAGVFRPSNSTWYISKSTGGTWIEQFGAVGDLPVPADYDGDGAVDPAVYRPALGQWWLKRSTAGVTAVTFGSATDKPVPGDYTGDGKWDAAIWRPGTGEWFILRSEDFTFYSFPFGANGDLPVSGDYDGDGKWDAAVFRPTNATWYLNQTTAGLLIQSFGLSNDQPVPNVFVP